MRSKLIMLVVAVLLAVNVALALPGSGTQEDPYRIESLADFDEFAGDSSYWDDHILLQCDIDLNGRTYEDAVITSFSGVFEGNSHRITNLTINGGDYVGFIGTNRRGEVRNLGLEACSVAGGDHVGGLMGYNIFDSHGSVTINCYSTGDVSGDVYVGGLVGLSGGIILNSYSTSNVSGNDSVGGLVGRVGLTGRFGFRPGSISDCYSMGYVSGYQRVGGLLGSNTVGRIMNCYSTCDVSGTGSKIGGLIGENRYLDIGFPPGVWFVSNCFWDIDTQTHGVSESIGYNEDTVTNVVGLSTPEMQTESTFTSAGWDFTTPIWMIDEGLDYPRLWWEISIEEGVEKKLEEIIVEVDNLPDDVFKNPNSANALINKLNATLKALHEENYGDVLDKLQNDILRKTDGCANEAEPDKNDWIIACEDQEKVYSLITRAIELLEKLLE